MPDKFYRVIECATRIPREDEVSGYDYNFITPETFDRWLSEGRFFETVQYQFGDDKYGACYSDLPRTFPSNTWTILVVSIEGLLSAIKNMEPEDTGVILNILLDEDADIERENRNAKIEENFNKSIIFPLLKKKPGSNFYYFSELVEYHQIKLSYLKTIRNDRKKLETYFNSILY